MKSELPCLEKSRSGLMDLPIGRRRFAQWLAASLALAGSRSADLAAAMPEDGPSNVLPPRKLRVAAIQMTPKLGDVAANLAQAETLVRDAIRRGAEWIVLPELFTSAAAFHEDMITADIELAAVPAPSELIPERFWLPEQMPQEWKDSWRRWFPRGEDYYRTVTLPYVATGELEDYIPPYLR